MAKKSGSLIIKVAVLLAVAGAVFFALDSWRKKSADSTAAPQADTATETTAPALSREEAERIGTEIGTRIGTEIGTQIGREVAAQMLAERKDQLAAARIAAKRAAKPEVSTQPVVEEPAAAEAPAPAVDTASTEPAAGAPARTETSHKRDQGTIPGFPVAQPAAGRDPWWIKSSTGDADALVLAYAGNFKSSDGSQKGIALMFQGRFDKQTDFANFISVSGGTSGQWQLGASPGLIYLPGVTSGNYTVTVKSGFKDADGKTLKTDISGPVDVH